MRSPEIPLVHALAWIVGSVLLVSGGAHALIQKGWRPHFKKQQQTSNDYLSVLIQTGPQKEALKTQYLAELLGLSADRPVRAEEFDCSVAITRLQACPVIARADVKIVPLEQEDPATQKAVYVDYTIRQPIAWLSDYENVVVDRMGYPFPLKPFFSPKVLPEFYLGLHGSLLWNGSIENPLMTLAFEIWEFLIRSSLHELCTIQRIDVSHAYAPSYGQREVVIILEDVLIRFQKGKEVVHTFPKILRLSTKSYAQELMNYLSLRETLLAKEKQEILDLKSPQAPPKVLDFRVPNLAFIPQSP